MHRRQCLQRRGRPGRRDLATDLETPVVARSSTSAVWVDGTLMVTAVTQRDPFESTGDDNPRTLVAFTSTETAGDQPPCELGPNASCRFADLSLVDGYPDFAELDLSGADPAFAELGDADLNGTDLTGATLWRVRSDAGSTLQGAILTGAELQDARSRSAVGADVSGANLRSAWIDDATGARFTGATLDRAWLGITDLAVFDGVDLTGARLDMLVPAAGPYEVSLAGLDLTDVTITGVHDEALLKILDLTGTALDGAAFRGVDLTAIGATIDLSAVDVWDDSLCPDGLPPDDPPIGTCVRGAPDG